MICKFKLTDSQQKELIEKASEECPLDPEIAREGLRDMLKLVQAGLVPGRSCWLFPFEAQQVGRPEFSNLHGCWILHPEDVPTVRLLLSHMGIEERPATRQGLRALTREYRKKNAALDKKLGKV